MDRHYCSFPLTVAGVRVVVSVWEPEGGHQSIDLWACTTSTTDIRRHRAVVIKTTAIGLSPAVEPRLVLHLEGDAEDQSLALISLLWPVLLRMARRLGALPLADRATWAPSPADTGEDAAEALAIIQELERRQRRFS